MDCLSLRLTLGSKAEVESCYSFSDFEEFTGGRLIGLAVKRFLKHFLLSVS
jgi:hypothetical protein